MVLTRAQTKSTTASKASKRNKDLCVTLALTSSGKIQAKPGLSSSEESDDEQPESWPPDTSDVRDGARKLRAKFKDMAIQREDSMIVDSTTDQQPACNMDPFSNVSTMGFEFAKSLDNTDGSGGMAVMVDSDSSMVAGKKSAFHTWQLQHQQSTQTHSNAHQATGLATMGLFALLPGELRNRIYRLVLLMTTPLPLLYPIGMPDKTCALGPCVHARLPTAVPGLLSSCRQIRREAMPIFLAENIGFRFEARMVESRCPANWIKVLGFYAQLVKMVVLEVIVCQSDGSVDMYNIELTCPQSAFLAQNEEGAMLGMGMGGFGINIEEEMKMKAPEQCEKIRRHVLELNARLTAGADVRTEEVLREFVGSDWLADVVWKCKK